MSSISQMERSSSQTRMLATRTASRCDSKWLLSMLITCSFDGGTSFGLQPPQSQYECCSLPGLRPSPDLAFMRLHDLVNNGKPKSGTALKVRLKGLENFLNLLRCHPGSGIREGDLPVLPQGFEGSS